MGTFIFLMIVVMVICALLVVVILSQNPKGGGLSSTFGGGGGQMFGVQRTNDFLDKATWTLSIIIAGVIILSNVMLPRGTTETSLPELPPIEQSLPAANPGNVDVNSENTAIPEATAPAKKEENELK